MDSSAPGCCWEQPRMCRVVAAGKGEHPCERKGQQRANLKRNSLIASRDRLAPCCLWFAPGSLDQGCSGSEPSDSFRWSEDDRDSSDGESRRQPQRQGSLAIRLPHHPTLKKKKKRTSRSSLFFFLFSLCSINITRVSSSAQKGRTPLYSSAEKGFLEAVELLLRFQADPEIHESETVLSISIPDPARVFFSFTSPLFVLLWSGEDSSVHRCTQWASSHRGCTPEARSGD